MTRVGWVHHIRLGLFALAVLISDCTDSGEFAPRRTNGLPVLIM
jgi:hypothetical protein